MINNVNLKFHTRIVLVILFITTVTSYSYSEPEDYNNEDSPSPPNYWDSSHGNKNYYYGSKNKEIQKEFQRGLSRNKLDDADKMFGEMRKSPPKAQDLDDLDWLPKASFEAPKKSKSNSQKPGVRKDSHSQKPGVRKDSHNRVQMGVSSAFCDDAKTNLTTDWDGSPVNYTCYHPESYYPDDPTKPPLLECVDLEKTYTPDHVCMDKTISYKDDIPTHGDHRPLWPMFGEYTFVPRERWLHNIEHGAVVMLYHPCANPSEVRRLKSIVTGCYGKHVITPTTFLPPDRPLALVAWGCRLSMAISNEEAAVSFIQEKSLKGPEGTYTKEGQYNYGLIQSANATGAGSRVGYARVDCDSSSFM